MDISFDTSVDGHTLVLSGDFDVRSTFQVRNAIYDLLQREHDSTRPAVIDISGVDNADLTALKVIAAASRVAQRSGKRMLIRGTSPNVLRMLHLSHLIRAVELDREPVPA